MNDRAFYQGLLQNFVEHGTLPDVKLHANDGLVCYLLFVMEQPDIAARLSSDQFAARIFLDTMGQFVCACLQKVDFMQRRKRHDFVLLEEAEHWNLDKIAHEGLAMVQTLHEQYADVGFNAEFYKKQSNDFRHCGRTLWNALLSDWQQCISATLERCKNQFIEQNGAAHLQLCYNNMEAVAGYVKTHGISPEQFFQAWALMGGRWNDLIYERLAKTVKLQNKYSVLKTVADVMGRVADASGNHAVGVNNKGGEKMPHASKSDIIGVTVGRNFESLVPHEWASFVDAELENVFLQKFVASRLQTFSYQSNSVHSARTLNRQNAKTCGPMVVCVDTSGSMAGEPWQIALSLTMSLSELCHKEKRECMLVTFSVGAVPVDLKEDRAALLKFFTRRAEGNTDVRMLLKLLPDLFTDERFFGGDVLWISDFRIPLPQERDYFDIVEKLQREGVRFFGLQLGIAENRWRPHFDSMFQIEDVHMLPC